MWNLIRLTMLLVNLLHRVASDQEGCGQTWFSWTHGVIMSPKYNLSSAQNNISCTYFVNAGPHNAIHLDIMIFNLDDNCTHAWLMITCNETNDENLDFRGRHCGTDLPRTSLTFTSCPVVELRYYSDSSGKNGLFRILYTVEITNANLDLPCGDTAFTSSSGVIELPRKLKEDGSATVNCTYTISTENTTTMSLDLGDSPLEFEQVLDSFVDCNRDYIMIGCVWDGETELNPNTSRKYCRRGDDHIHLQPSRNVFPNCRMVKISMHSSNYNYRASYGFLFAVHSSDADCGNSSFIGPTGTILSPGYPLSYPPNLDCVYTIDVDRTKTTSFDFLQFNLEGTSKFPKTDVCFNDWLKVSCLSDGTVRRNPSLENKYCGKITTPITLSYSNCDFLTLNFVTDSSVSRDGFQLRYTIVSENGTSSEPDVPDEGCGNTSFSGHTGLINSPRFPLSYPNNLDCVYSIDVDETETVVLHFLTFNLEGTPHSTYLDDCIYDWILISCISDGVEKEQHRTARRKYCGERTTPLILTYSNCDSLTLSFVTDSSHTSGGFQLKYTVKDITDKSTETFVSGTNGVVTSPSYPYPYPHNQSVSYVVEVGRKSSILLRFIYFEMEMPDSEGHCKDWLMITCNDTTKWNPNNGMKYCGIIRWTSSLRFVDCPTLELEFFSDSHISAYGFMIEYTATENSNSTNDNSELECGATLFNNTSGVIDLPGNTKNYLATVDCTYTISANQLSDIWLDIRVTQGLLQLLESFQDCDRESLTIGCVSEEETEKPNNTTVILCRYGRSALYSSPNRLLIADCRKLQLSIRSTNYDYSETFLIPFQTVGPNGICGNTLSFSASNGVISTRRLPWHYRRSTNCLYTIDTGHVTSVVLIFELQGYVYAETGNSPCNYGWWTITCLMNGTSVAHPLADRKLCGTTNSMTARYPACRSVFLNFSSNAIPTYMRFSVRYWMGDYDPECGSTSFNGPNGVISSPRFPLSYPHNLNCLYSITGGQGNAIILSFLTLDLEGFSNMGSFDSCHTDWLTVSCLSDQFAAANSFSSRKYCGLKMKPFKLTFASCQVVLVNFQSDASIAEGGFEIRYAVVDKESVCGVSVYGPPSGMISFQSNYTKTGDSLDCNYFINAAEPTSISFTISSTGLLGSGAGSCQSDWLLITCINDQTTLDHKISQRTCNRHNLSTQITFSSCLTTQIVFHKVSEVGEEAFRIEYTINVDGSTQSSAISASTQFPVTYSPKCEDGCTKRNDGTTCDCSTMHSGDSFVNNQLSVSAKHGHAVGISLAVVLVVAGAICLGAFLLFRRHRKMKRPQLLMQETAEVLHTLELEDDIDTTKAGHRNEDQDISKYLPLKPMSISDHDASSSGNNCLQIHSEIQPSL